MSANADVGAKMPSERTVYCVHCDRSFPASFDHRNHAIDPRCPSCRRVGWSYLPMADVADHPGQPLLAIVRSVRIASGDVFKGGNLIERRHDTLQEAVDVPHDGERPEQQLVQFAVLLIVVVE